MFKKVLSLAIFTCLLSLSVFAKDIQKAELTAKMESNKCKNNVEKILKNTNGVEKVNANMKSQSVKVEFDKSVVSEAQLVEAINKANASCNHKDMKTGCTKDAKSCDKPCTAKKDAKSCSAVKEGKKDGEGCSKKCNK